ncbi:heme NO-binding domain-containing protein [Vibrio nigripulchritudo]|uniref:heme NO-binding domain-containing protein n=1 Tax=Vibrio nigripulchritudo TaxID=28173 RepID=UPI0005FA0C0A|nr:heme NO-binding domain-containing protein [Vibrio nigripulchritudo]KJY80855.1 guanylate cyclase [Vibrio nigripulchritudo]
MKGLIFTEFLELVEEKFGLPTVDKILFQSEDDGIYTSVGSYDHRDLVKLIVALSKETGVAPEDLQEVFGRTVFNKLLSSLAPEEALSHSQCTFQFLRHVEEYIHLEVKKLYPDAHPPKFTFQTENESELVMDYKSARCMGSVCKGLILGCADHFSEKLKITMNPMTDNASHVRFILTKV